MAENASRARSQTSDGSRRQAGMRGPGAVAAVATGETPTFGFRPGLHAIGWLAGGSPLPDDLRSEMETRFGTGFEDVRVHARGPATFAAHGLDANAFTVGPHIAFAPSQYQPGSMSGRRLLAHELAHVVQQRRGGRTPALDPGAAHERGADAAAGAYANGATSISVSGATGVGIARDAARKQRRDASFYKAALNGNRYWCWQEGKARIDGWPVDEHLATLWSALGIPMHRPGPNDKGAPMNDATLPQRPEFVDFADTVADFQHAHLGHVDPSFEGTVHPETAAKLREQQQASAAATEKKSAKPAAAAAAESGIGSVGASASGTFSASGSISGTAFVGATGSVGGSVSAGSSSLLGTVGAIADPFGLVDKAADLASSLGADEIEDIVLGVLSRAIPGLSGARLLREFGKGVAHKLYVELVKKKRGVAIVKRFLDMGGSDVLQLYKGYIVGLVEGLISPVTDLFGLIVLGESVTNIVKDALVNLLIGPGDFGKELADLEAAAGRLTVKIGEFADDVRQHPLKYLEAAVNAPDALDKKMLELANGLGESAAEWIVDSIDAPFTGKETAEKKPDPIRSPAAYIEYLAKVGESKVIDTPWSKFGLKIGYAVGFVAVQVLLLVFTSGIGNGVLKVAGLLGDVANWLGKLGRIGKAAGAVVSEVAELAASVGKAIEFLEKGAAKAIEAAAKRLPILEKLLGPVGELFEKLQKFLQKLFGVADRDSAAVVRAVTGASEKATPLARELHPPPIDPHVPPPGDGLPKAKGLGELDPHTPTRDPLAPDKPAGGKASQKAKPDVPDPGKPTEPPKVTDTKPAAKSRPAKKTTSKPVADAKAGPEPKPSVETPPAKKPAKAKPAKKAKPATKTTPDPELEAKPTPDSSAKPSTESEASGDAAAAKADTETPPAKAKSKGKGKSKAKGKPAAKAKPEPKAEPKPKPKAKAKAKPKPKAKAKPAPKDPAKPAAKRVRKPSPKPSKEVKSLDELIADAKNDLGAAREKTGEYFDEREAAGESRKGGPKKAIDNAKERIWMLERQKAYPNRRMLGGGRVVGVRGVDGELVSTTSIADVGRNPDFIEIDGDHALLGELKYEWELNRSLTGGPGTKQGGTTSISDSSKLGGQFDTEDKVIARARETGGKVVISGYDVQTGELVERELNPDEIGRGLFSSTAGFGTGSVHSN